MTEYVTRYLSNLSSIEFVGLVGWALLFGFIGLIVWNMNRPIIPNTKPGFFTIWWGKRMDRKERRRYVKQFTADKITSVLEDAIANDDLSRKEVNNIYRQLAQYNEHFRQKRVPPADDLEVNTHIPLKDRILMRLRLSNYKPVAAKVEEATASKTE